MIMLLAIIDLIITTDLFITYLIMYEDDINWLELIILIIFAPLFYVYNVGVKIIAYFTGRFAVYTIEEKPAEEEDNDEEY